jgi:hypothetical protein
MQKPVEVASGGVGRGATLSIFLPVPQEANRLRAPAINGGDAEFHERTLSTGARRWIRYAIAFCAGISGITLGSTSTLG